LIVALELAVRPELKTGTIVSASAALGAANANVAAAAHIDIRRPILKARISGLKCCSGTPLIMT
jgi:hypothetical protein